MAASNPQDKPSSTGGSDAKEQSAQTKDQAPQKPSALGEDDEFEDFPIEDWVEEESEAARQDGTTKHLWEESWDDDDTSDDFSTQLKEELQKVEASKKR